MHGLEIRNADLQILAQRFEIGMAQQCPDLLGMCSIAEHVRGAGSAQTVRAQTHCDSCILGMPAELHADTGAV